MCNNNNRNCGCRDEIDVEKICTDCIIAKKAKIHKVIANDICSQAAQVGNLLAVSQTVNNLCATNANITNACITNLTTSTNFVPNTSYRATVNYGVNTVYTLGSLIKFDNIVDDPNNNVSLVPNFQYIAPASGYYMLTFKMNVTNVVPTNGPILGVPVANLLVYVNGIEVRETFSPFITFFNFQDSLIASLITLQAGDKVTLAYNVLGGGGVPVVGNVNVIGSGVEDGNSLFKIIFLSSSSASVLPPIVCTPCAPVVLPCGPLNNDC